MKNNFLIIKIVFFTLSAAFVFDTYEVKSAAAATIILNPSGGTYEVGEVFNVDVNINTKSRHTDGVSINSITYNPALLEVQDTNSIQSGAQIKIGSLYKHTQQNTVENGKITISQVNTGGVTYNSVGTFATITFKVLAVGKTDVVIQHTPGNLNDSNIVGEENGKAVDILSGVTNATFDFISPIDRTSPIIDKVASSDITTTGAVIGWVTDELSDSQVEYGTTVNYGSNTTLNSVLTSNHSLALTGLKPNTIYHYRVKSSDAAGNLALSSDYIFTTASPPVTDTTPPVISNINTVNADTESAIIDWTTNELSTSQIEYGIVSTYGSISPLDTTKVLQHQMELTGLAPSTKYYYRVFSKDGAGNEAQSTGQTFVTEAIAPPVIDTIAPAPIGDLRVLETTEKEVILGWTAVGDDLNVGTATGYEIRYSNSSISSKNWARANKANISIAPASSGTKEKISIKDLNPSTRYYFAMKVNDEAGNISSLSNVVTATTKNRVIIPDTTPPAEVGNFSSSIDSKNRIVTLTWNKPVDSDFSGVVIRRKEKAEPRDRLDGRRIYAGSDSQHSDRYVTVETQYHYKIFTFDNKYNYSSGVDISVIVPKEFKEDTTPPSAPVRFKATYSRNTVSLSWKNPRNADFDKVIIRRKENSPPKDKKDGFLTYEGKLSNASDSSTREDRTYYYAIFALDKNLNVSEPAHAQVRTKSPFLRRLLGQ